MSSSSDLLRNTIIFGISNFASKFLGILMLPFYTRILSTKEFGTADLIITTVSLILPFFSLGISDAALRFALDNNENKKHVFSFGIKILIIGYLILLILFPLFYKINFISKYIYLFYSLYLFSILQNYFSLFARSINKIKLVGLAGIINTLTLVITSIIFLYVFNLNVKGFLLAFIISNFVTFITLLVGGKLYNYFTFSHARKGLFKEMIIYSIPLVPNSISWWINNTSSRYFINYFLNISEVGLYAAASRMPSILIAFQGVFNQAWQISAISEYDKKDRTIFFSKVYLAYNSIMVIGCSVLIFSSKFIAVILFSHSFYGSWIFTPFLFVSVVFGAMVGFYSSLYLAEKKTKLLLLSTLLGAFVTILLNIILLKYLDTMGASIAAVFAYFSVWLYLHINSKEFIFLNIDFHNIYYQYFILLIQALLTVTIQSNFNFITSFICFLLLFYLNRKGLVLLSKMIKPIIIKLKELKYRVSKKK